MSLIVYLSEKSPLESLLFSKDFIQNYLQKLDVAKLDSHRAEAFEICIEVDRMAQHAWHAVNK